ncbi:MAG: heavy-metal-associated domain-containing protein [Gammaproteobacteria bacterium]|nr:heavy-metal-associated domain-containing protein [Gammaproteobacteria bacterium]
MNQVTEIAVEGMQCSACAESVERVVGQLVGVESVSVNLDAAIATVTYDEACVQLADLNDAIEDAGFDVGLS